MAVEREIKLQACDPATLLAVGQDAMLLQLAPVCHQIRDVYLDTRACDLLQRRLALRMRQQGSDWLVTVKGHGGVVNGVSIRQEWEQKACGPSQCPGDLPAGLRDDQLAFLPPDLPWHTLMTVTMERRLWSLALPTGTLVEMALDAGMVTAGNRCQPFWEVELEAKAGAFEPVTRLAAELMQRHPLQPASHSKFTLGLALLGIDPRSMT